MTIIDENLKKAIGKRLYDLRTARGLTRAKVLDQLNDEYHLELDERSLRRYENGTYMPKIDNLIFLSEYFGVSLDYIVYGRQTSDDDSYTWKDTLKRLNRLIYSSVLIPRKEEDTQSPFYGKYYFAAYDEEITTYMERLTSFFKSKNYDFEVRGKGICISIADMDTLTEDFADFEDDLRPSLKRMNEVLAAAHEDPENFMSERIQTIQKKRKNK